MIPPEIAGCTGDLPFLKELNEMNNSGMYFEFQGLVVKLTPTFVRRGVQTPPRRC